MKKLVFFSFFFAGAIVLSSCQNRKSNNSETNVTRTSLSENISVDEFQKRISETEDPQIVDVRTAEEFNQGFIGGAVNVDIHATDFEKTIEKLDKTKPVFVYCLAGGRSVDAAEIMHENGFLQVYNLNGGIMKWRAADKPIKDIAAIANNAGLTMQDFNKLLSTEKFVLVDYNAKWCKPCMKMAPMLETLAQTKKDKLRLVKIDADINKELLKQKGIEGIPVLELYKDKKLVWQHEGEIDQNTLLQETKL